MVSSQKIRLFLATSIVWGVSWAVASTIGNTITEVARAPSPLVPTQTPPTTSPLLVQPAQGGPKPLNYPIQGTAPQQQNAAGDLQQPQTTDQLQPNAKIDEFPDDL